MIPPEVSRWDGDSGDIRPAGSCDGDHALTGFLKSIAVPEKHAGSLRVRQLDMVRRITFVMILANLLNAGIVMFCFLGTASSDFLYIWGW